MGSIEEFYVDKCVFITGATGFLGKALLEKLLRSCRRVKRIYLLTRARPDQTPQQRIDKMLQAKLFEKVRETPSLIDKVTAIKGDISEPGLGMSSEDRDLIKENVHIVFHSAATVRFDEELRTSLKTNVKGTEEMIKLCKEAKQLKVLVHVSSAYANCDRDVIEEKIYPPTVEPEKLIKSLEWMTDNMVAALTPALIDKRPNTYTFTKSLAEHILLQQATDLPVAIFRPSIIGASMKEPVPGWVDNFNGPSGLLVMAGKGMLRSMRGDLNAISDIIPVDIAVNMMICVAWKTALIRSNDIPVYHCCSGTLNPVTWGQLAKILQYKATGVCPMEDVFRRPNFNFESRKLWHVYWKYISHKIPALIVDTMSVFLGKKPRMHRLYSKIDKATDVLNHFTLREWQFSSENCLQLLSHVSREDKEVFNFDIRDLEWDSYLENFFIGIKNFLLNEDTDNLDMALRRIRKLRNIRWSMYALLFGLFSWLMIKRFPNLRGLLLRCFTRVRIALQVIGIYIGLY